MSREANSFDEVIHAGGKRLLARATNPRSIDEKLLTPRLKAVVDKYLCKGQVPPATEIENFLDGLHADDLCLALACERGDQDAWSDLFEEYGATVRSAARSASSNEAMADDLAHSIWAELHGLKTREDGQAAGKLAYYSGAGSLGGWLRAVVGQLAIDQHRRQARLVQTEQDTDLDRLAHEIDDQPVASTFHSSCNPEDELARDRAAADVERALAQALSELDPEDRLLLKLYYFDGLRMREAGAVLGFHEATASRRLSRVHREVREHVEAILMKHCGWTRSEAVASLAEVAAHLQSELEPLLSAPVDASLQSSPAGG
jgi:RNA polymerase sigma-70 factor (ECF subfamily)